MRHLVAKFATNVSGAILLPSSIQVTESIFGSVMPLAMFYASDLPLDEARSVGKPPREVNVGVYIHRALWEVILFIVASLENHSVASNIS